MKRLGIFLFVLVLGYIFYYDIKIGTLPMLSSYKKDKCGRNDKTRKYKYKNKKKKTKRKKKQMSLIKQLKSKQVIRFFPLQKLINKKKIPSIEKVIDDFKQLNKNTPATKIQLGKSYKFPLYQ